MMKIGLLILFLAGVLVPVSALQASDAESVLAQGHYLNENERAAVFKALPQMNGILQYWVVSIYLNDALKTILPVVDKDGKLVEKGALRTNLISAQLLVQRIAVLKSTAPWLISLSTANKLNEIATAIDNEQFDVDIVAQSVASTSVKSDVSALKGKLATLSSALRTISEEIKSLNDAETQFLNVSIDTAAVNGISSEYSNVYDALVDAAAQANAYDVSVAQAKSRIASLANVDSSSKSQWIALLSPLGPNLSLTSAVSPYTDLAVENKQRLSVEIAAIPTKVAALESEADARGARANAYLALYGEDANLKKSTNFSSLQEGVQTILAEENRARWKDTASVAKLETTWINAEKAFARAQYKSAADLAISAKALVKKIKDAGIAAVEDPNQQLSNSLISGLVLILAGAAVILIGKTLWKYVKPHPPADE